MSTTEPNTCTYCKNAFTGSYCNNCGQKIYTEKDKSVKHLFGDFFHFLFHFEGTFLKTLKTLFTAPGKVSLDYCNGIRKPYFKPLSLFLLIVLVYLLFPFFEGLNQRLEYYPNSNFWGQYAEKQIEFAKARTGLSFDQLQERFSQKSAGVAKFLLVVIIPLSALWFWLFTFRRRKHFYDQFVFATEVNTVYILFSYLALPVFIIIYVLFHYLITGANPVVNDRTLTVIIVPTFLIYLSVASFRFYRYKKWKTFLLSIVFFFGHFFILQALYKFILFTLVMLSIK